jgi:tetratricopeptide (TPR) repeat protein
MKKIILNIFALLFALYANADNQAIIKQANQDYTKGNYEQAVSGYEKVINLGVEAPELYYNLGNAYYKQQKYTLAILNYERAKQLDPANDNINTNLELAKIHVVDKIDEVPVFFLARWYNSFVNTLSCDTWAVTSIVFFGLMLLSVGLFLFLNQGVAKKITFSLALISLLITVSGFIFTNSQRNRILSHQSAIVFTPTVTVRSEPDEKGKELFVLHEGTKISIIETVGEWSELKLANGNVGWVKNSDFIKI